MRYTLNNALASIQQYEWTGTPHLLAVLRLTRTSEDNPGGLRAEALRIRNAFYAYSEGYHYGSP
jgi:hypothetical protein